jgi:hypothetical protein
MPFIGQVWRDKVIEFLEWTNHAKDPTDSTRADFDFELQIRRFETPAAEAPLVTLSTVNGTLVGIQKEAAQTNGTPSTSGQNNGIRVNADAGDISAITEPGDYKWDVRRINNDDPAGAQGDDWLVGGQVTFYELEVITAYLASNPDDASSMSVLWRWNDSYWGRVSTITLESHAWLNGATLESLGGDAPVLAFKGHRGPDYTPVVSNVGDTIAQIDLKGFDGLRWSYGARLYANVTGTPDSGLSKVPATVYLEVNQTTIAEWSSTRMTMTGGFFLNNAVGTVNNAMSRGKIDHAFGLPGTVP